MPHSIAIPRKLTHGNELIVVDRREYESLKVHLAEVKDALQKIRRGEDEFKRGKTLATVRSLSELRKR